MKEENSSSSKDKIFNIKIQKSPKDIAPKNQDENIQTFTSMLTDPTITKHETTMQTLRDKCQLIIQILKQLRLILLEK